LADKVTPEACFELLTHKSIHDRAEGARQLALIGKTEHIAQLMAIAQSDKSPAVRLGCAGAAADILSRHRTGHARRKLTMPDREAILAEFRAMDPGVNPGLFAVLATLDVPRALDRIIVGLRDPRYDVRQGAGVGLLRYCTSGSVARNERIPNKVIALLGDKRIRADVLAGIMRVCVACGWQAARGPIEQHLDRGDQVGKAAEECLALLDTQVDPETFLGAWAYMGLDAGEVRAKTRAERVLVFSEGVALVGVRGESYTRTTWALTDDGELVLGDGEPERFRRMWLSLPGAEPVHAFQTGGDTWYAADPEASVDLVLDWLASTESDSVADRKSMGAVLLPLLPDNAAGHKVAARIELASGLGAEAVVRVQAVLSKRKKPPAEFLWLLAQGQDQTGDTKAATKTWKQYLERAGAKGEHLAQAQARLAK
jgi:hypothetical protein